MKQTMLTTIDNPFNPWTQFDEWYAFDVDKNYNTCSYLARICETSSELSEEQQNQAIEQAIDEIIEINVLGIYTRVAKDDVINPQPVTLS